MCWRRHSRLVLSGRPTFTTWTGRSPAARSTWSATVDPFSRRDQCERRRDPITSWQAPAWRAARISPEAGSPALTSTQSPAQFAEQPAVLLQPRLRRLVEVVDRPDVHPLEPGIGQPGEMGGVADEPFVGGRPLQADHDDRGLHRLADAVGGEERRDRIGNRVIEPELREFPQGSEIREAEIARQCRIHPLPGDDQALGQPVPQRRGRQVDELDLAGPHERIRHRLGRAHAGDPGDDLRPAIRCWRR